MKGEQVIAKVLSLRPREWAFFLWAIPLVIAGTFLRKRPPSTLSRVLGSPGVPQPDHTTHPGPTKDPLEADAGQAIRRAAHWVPGTHNCLAQAIAGHVMLRALRLPSSIVIGLDSSSTGAQWDTHAWLLGSEGFIVGGEIASRFSAVTIYQNSVEIYE